MEVVLPFCVINAASNLLSESISDMNQFVKLEGCTGGFICLETIFKLGSHQVFFKTEL